VYKIKYNVDLNQNPGQEIFLVVDSGIKLKACNNLDWMSWYKTIYN